LDLKEHRRVGFEGGAHIGMRRASASFESIALKEAGQYQPQFQLSEKCSYAHAGAAAERHVGKGL